MSVFPSSSADFAFNIEPTFPYLVLANGGVQAPISNGVITFGLDYETLTVNGGISDPSLFTLAVLNETTGEYEQTSLDAIPTTTTGDVRTPVGDAAYIILNTDRYVALTATLTAARAWTLPAASSVSGGTRIVIQDEAGGISSTNTITFGVTGADTINGTTTYVLATARGGVEFRSDGTSKWSARVIGTVALADEAVTTAKVAAKAITLAKQADVATASVLGRVTAGTGVQEVLTGAQVRDSILPSGFIIDRAYAEDATNTNLTTVIPLDDTIPQNTEGTQILSVSITPKSTTNRIRVRFQCAATVGTVSAAIAALFVNSGANAVAASYVTIDAADFERSITLEYEYVPGSTSAQTLAIRVGPSTGTMRLNGLSTARRLGGTMRATLIAEEVKA